MYTSIVTAWESGGVWLGLSVPGGGGALSLGASRQGGGDVSYVPLFRSHGARGNPWKLLRASLCRRRPFKFSLDCHDAARMHANLARAWRHAITLIAAEWTTAVGAV